MMSFSHPVRSVSLVLLFVVYAGSSAGAQPRLSRDHAEEFLRTAEVVDATRAGTGTTRPWRLTLSDGTTTHDALFQSIDDRSASQRLADGQTILNFADSFEFNIAAYKLAKLVGLSHMVPVTVRRQWRDEIGSLSWWIDDVMFDEQQRIDEGIDPPSLGAWQAQLLNMRLFSALVDDTDRNQGNVIYSNGWRLWMIDFTRAFTISEEIRHPELLDLVNRALYARLQMLDAEEVRRELSSNLDNRRIGALLARRDKLVELVQRRIAEDGEDSVLF